MQNFGVFSIWSVLIIKDSLFNGYFFSLLILCVHSQRQMQSREISQLNNTSDIYFIDKQAMTILNPLVFFPITLCHINRFLHYWLNQLCRQSDFVVKTAENSRLTPFDLFHINTIIVKVFSNPPSDCRTDGFFVQILLTAKNKLDSIIDLPNNNKILTWQF